MHYTKTMSTGTKLLLAAALAAAFSIHAAPASASTLGNAPWCAVQNLGDGDVVWDCEFQSVEQCQPAVIAGNRGFCNLNPYLSQYQPAPSPVYHHKYRHHQS